MWRNRELAECENGSGLVSPPVYLQRKSPTTQTMSGRQSADASSRLRNAGRGWGTQFADIGTLTPAACNVRIWAGWRGLRDSLAAAVGTQCVPWLLAKY